MIIKKAANISRALLWFIFGSLMAFAMALPASANTKVIKIEELNQKIADIGLLHQQLIDRNDQVTTIRNALLSQKSSLTAEISILAKSLKITTYSEAAHQLRIRNNLELLRSITAYLDELDIKALYYQNGRNKLEYLKKMAEDDVKMISTINDLKIEALMTQISLVVNHYLPEAHVIEIKNDHIIKPSAQTIWQEIMAKKN